MDGINENTSKQVKKSGADILVAGTYIIKQADFGKAIKNLKE